MSRKQKKKDAREQSTRQLMGIDDITDYGIATRMGELVFFAIKPTNISVLPDSKHLDRIQVLMASSREFYILVRLQGKKESDVFSYLSRIEKSIKDNGFTVHRATEEDLKRMLGVYFEQNVTTERYEDHDGERWVLFGE